MHSLWQKQSFYFSTDIIIVGAGITGLLSALKLKSARPELSIRILEKGIYPEGASVKNAGFACFGSVSEILDDIDNEGESAAFERVIERFKGLNSLFKEVDPESIDLLSKGGVEVFTSKEKGLLDKSLDHLDGINQRLTDSLGFTPFKLSSEDFGLNVLPQHIQMQGEATLNSGKLVKQLLDKAIKLGVEVNFGTEVSSLEKEGDHWRLHTGLSSFKCHKVLLATNGFTSNLLPNLPVLPARGQIVLTSKIDKLKIDRSFHLHQGYFYFRNFEGALLLGGGRHLDRANESVSDQTTTPLIQEALENMLREVILPHSDFEIVKRWAGTMAFGPKNEKEAIVKQEQPGLYVAVRLGGMGVAMAALVAEKTKDMMI